MNPMKILLVDDSKSARYALRLQLQRHGAVVETADSAEAALERIKEDLPDAVFMDHTMPGMNGFEALEILKSASETAHLPVVMCTSNEDPEFLAQARRKGAVDILSKATAPDKLPALLTRLNQSIATLQTAAARMRPEDGVPPGISSPGAAADNTHANLDDRVRSLIEPMLESFAERLSAQVTADTEKRVLALYQEEAKRLQQHFIHAQSEQAQLTTNRLVNELLPRLVHQQLDQEQGNVARAVEEQIAQERQQVAHMVQEMIDASVDQLAEEPAFMRRILGATEAKAANSAEKIVKRHAHEITETFAAERAREVADNLIPADRGLPNAMYLLAAGAAGIGIAAATIVYLLVR